MKFALKADRLGSFVKSKAAFLFFIKLLTLIKAKIKGVTKMEKLIKAWDGFFIISLYKIYGLGYNKSNYANITK